MRLSPEVSAFFDGRPEELAIFEAAFDSLSGHFPGLTPRAQKSQIALRLDRTLCALWLPLRRVKGRPEHCVVLTFSLRRRVRHGRIVQSAEPYPGRFTHHVLLTSGRGIDASIVNWLQESLASRSR